MTTATGTHEIGPLAGPVEGVRVARLRRWSADGVWAVHIGIVALVLSAWALPFPELWWAMIVLAPLMHLQWWLNDDVCILTTLENRLRGDPVAGRSEQEPFVGRLLRPLSGELTARDADRLCKTVNWIVFGVCALRLAR